MIDNLIEDKKFLNDLILKMIERWWNQCLFTRTVTWNYNYDYSQIV